MVLILCSVPVVHATVMEVGDLNIIDDAGNPSDGLRYLDMSYSDGLTQAAALAAAQVNYANARLATPSEFDDLFAAAGISYNGALTVADGFTDGSTAGISSGSNYDGGALRLILGLTNPAGFTNIWTDPDGSSQADTTRDRIILGLTGATVVNSTSLPPNDRIGWLLVSDAASVPEPTTLALMTLGLAALGLRHRLI